MAESSIRVDKVLRPAYYDDFHCIMGACRYNCCDDGWNIHFSKKDYLTVKRAPKSPELEELTGKCLHRLREQEHDGFYAGFRASDAGRCAFHSPEGLCRLQLECGEKTLPTVCRTFPRSERYTPGYFERSLSPACEAVLALLWDLPEGVEFRSDPLPREQWKNFTPAEDNPLPQWFSVVREWCVDILQNRRFTLPQRIFLMGMGLKSLADGEENIERWMERAAALPDSVDMANILPAGDQELTMYLSSCAHILSSTLPPDVNRLKIHLGLLIEMGLRHDADSKNVVILLDPYREARARFEERFAGRDYFMENLMVTVFFCLGMPYLTTRENLWKGYVNFCNLYAFYRFLAVMSCREGAPGDRDELFRMIVHASRSLIHDRNQRNRLRDELFKHDSATLAHMAILLCG